MALETNTFIAPAGDEKLTRVSWGAIFSGLFIFLGLELMWTLLASAIGLMINLREGGGGIGVGTGIYLFITTLISFYVAGFATSRLSGYRLRSNAVLSALTVWGLAIALSAYFIGSGVGALLAGATQMAGEVVIQTQPQGSGSQSGGTVDQSADKASNQMQQDTKSPKVRQAAGQVKATAEKGIWWAFITVVFGGLFAILGGIAGSRLYRERPGELTGRRAA